MAKRRAIARTRKAARKTKKTATRNAPRRSAKGARRKTAAAKKRAPARKTAARRTAAAKRRSPRAKSRSKRARRAGARPKPAALQRERRQLRDEGVVASTPSTLGYSHKASSAESGQVSLHHRRREHTEGGPALTSGDVDTDWNDAYSSGEETPGGDMPTPDQDIVEEIGRALGVEYEDAEELKGSDKIEKRDRHRWEYDPASAEDYKDRNRKQ